VLPGPGGVGALPGPGGVGAPCLGLAVLERALAGTGILFRRGDDAGTFTLPCAVQLRANRALTVVGRICHAFPVGSCCP